MKKKVSCKDKYTSVIYAYSDIIHMNAFYLFIYFCLKKGRFWSFHTQTPKRFADTKVVV